MNKYRKSLIITCTVVFFAFTMTVAATVYSVKLSPALDIISQEHTMIKTGNGNDALCFTKDDFFDHTGVESASIKITSLPSEAEGTLMLGMTKVSVGQNISWGNLDLLRFISEQDTKECSFKFTANGDYITECIIKIAPQAGDAPSIEAGGIKAQTYADVSCSGILQANDSDGDIMLYQVTSYPENGIVSITDTKAGKFKYTPYDGYTGVDSFSYRVRDEMGNYSEECQVSLEILESDMTEAIADMEDHYAYSAAMAAVSEGYMHCVSENGSLYFDPDETITRCDYLYTVMDALGCQKLAQSKTVFADSADIDPQYSGYVAAAYKLGIICGIDSENGLIFAPNEPITRAEAAVILNRILGAKGESTSDSWAEKDISALEKLGIMSISEKTSDGSISLTRAEAAQMLFVTKNIYS